MGRIACVERFAGRTGSSHDRHWSVVLPAARGVAIDVALGNAGGKQRVALKVELKLQVR
jgi:hypothetical protein